MLRLTRKQIEQIRKTLLTRNSTFYILSGFFLLGVTRNVELVEQVCEDDEIALDAVEGDGLRGVDASIDEVHAHRQKPSHDELQHLRLGEEHLQAGVEPEGSEDVVSVHERVDEGVEADQDRARASVLGHHE